MQRFDLDENTRAFVALCRAEAQRLQAEFKTTNDLLNKQLAGIAERAGLKGSVQLSADGTYLSVPDEPAPSAPPAPQPSEVPPPPVPAPAE